MRFAALLAVVSTLHLAALDDPFRARARGMGVELGAENLLGGDFRFGDQRYGWDNGLRYVLAVRSRVDFDGPLEPYGGIDLYWEERDGGINNGGSLHYQALGFQLVSALAIHLLPNAEQRQFTLAATPSLSGGFGWHGTSVRHVSSGTLDVSDEIENARLELGVGVGLRAAFRQRWVAEIGLGARVWTAGTVVVNGDDGVNPEPQAQTIAFSGDETFARFTIGFWW
jgi:hypothetical protein